MSLRPCLHLCIFVLKRRTFATVTPVVYTRLLKMLQTPFSLKTLGLCFSVNGPKRRLLKMAWLIDMYRCPIRPLQIGWCVRHFGTVNLTSFTIIINEYSKIYKRITCCCRHIYIYIRGGTVHRCHGSVRTSVRGSRFDTISVQHEKNKIYYARFLFIYFEQTVVQIKKNPSRCENSTYYYMLYIKIRFVFTNKSRPLYSDY